MQMNEPPVKNYEDRGFAGAYKINKQVRGVHYE